jgi:histidinol-phosphate phosphatase family protein
MKNRAVFLDRDGTIMEDSHFVGEVERVVLLPGSVRALARLSEAGFRLYVVTNQSGVGRGYFTRDDVDRVHAHLDERFAREGVRIERYLVCPHHPDEGCDCRKPAPGPVLRLAREARIDLARSFVVGDRASDIRLGENVGARTVLVLTGIGREASEDPELRPDHVAPDLAEAVDWILEAAAGTESR